MAGRLLLVDDDRFILNHLERLLGGQGYRCTTAVDADAAWRALQAETFDLIILDIGLPDVDGLSLCRRIRTRHRQPIIMLTARDGASDKVLGLELGADDYVTKPFEAGEIVARVRAQLRRSQEYAEEITERRQFAVGALAMDLSAHEVRVEGRTVALTGKEFDLLQVLMRHAGQAMARDWLFEQVWGWDAEFGIKTLAVYIRRLRCKVEADPDRPRYIQTVRGFGYKLTGGTE